MNSIEYITRLKRREQELAKDRLDFGFDSIYFRYAAVIDELAFYKMSSKYEPNHYMDKEYWERWANRNKMHFYNVLEQLTHAHEGDNNVIK